MRVCVCVFLDLTGSDSESVRPRTPRACSLPPPAMCTPLAQGRRPPSLGPCEFCRRSGTQWQEQRHPAPPWWRSCCMCCCRLLALVTPQQSEFLFSRPSMMGFMYFTRGVGLRILELKWNRGGVLKRRGYIYFFAICFPSLKTRVAVEGRYTLLLIFDVCGFLLEDLS